MRQQLYFESGAGVTQLVEWQLPKLQVAGSNPVSRSPIVRKQSPTNPSQKGAFFTPELCNRASFKNRDCSATVSEGN